MSDPRRLLDDASGLERSLLRSWKADRPSPASKAAAVSLVTVAPTTLLATKVGGKAAGAASAAAPKIVFGASALKLIGIAALATSAAIAYRATTSTPDALSLSATAGTAPASSGDSLARRPPQTAAPLPSGSAVPESGPRRSTPARPTPARAERRSSGARCAEATTGRAAPSSAATGATTNEAEKPTTAMTSNEQAAPPESPPGTSPEAPKPQDALPPSAPRSELGLQVTAIDRARSALDAGQAARCLALLDDYARAYPAGAMFEEATLLRIQALLGQGNTAAARDVASAFVAARPGSPHVAKIRRLALDNP